MERVSTDQLEQQLLARREVMSRITGEQLEILEELDRRQVATGDGSRSLSEWVAAKLDLTTDTAKALVRTMRRTSDRADLREALASGVSFDRVEALSCISANVGPMEHVDVAAVHREASACARITAETEARSANDMFLVVQPSLDESWWKVWGGLDGYSGAIFDKVLAEKADQLPELPDGTLGDPSWRRAMALVELCMSDDPPPAQVTVLVDAGHAAASNAEAGVVLEAGPRVGRQALEALLCDAVTEVVTRAENGRYMDYGRKFRVVPPSLRRALMDKYLGACAIDGCSSWNRLQAHHVIPWSRGGRTDQDNLILLCWYHHHVAIHQRGLELYAAPDHGRIRLRRPERGPPD